MIDKRIILLQGDITNSDTDAIVNAANSSLMGGGGVDGAIHAAGGPSILDECRLIIEKSGPLETGKSVFTNAGNLLCRYVIHTVGPVWQGGEFGEAELLSSSYRTSLELAKNIGARSISFPNISTGVYGFPKKEAAQIAVKVVSDFLKDNQSFNEIRFYCFDSENFNIYSDLIKKEY